MYNSINTKKEYFQAYINNVINFEMLNSLLGYSKSYIHRLIKRYKKDGDAIFIHGNTNEVQVNKIKKIKSFNSHYKIKCIYYRVKINLKPYKKKNLIKGEKNGKELFFKY